MRQSTYFMRVLAVAGTILLVACGAQPAAPTDADRARLAAVLAAQPAEVKARYRYRNPQQTMEFFELRPGMTVVESLPGSLWYTHILMNYLGANGSLIGANYPPSLLANFPWMSEARLAEQKVWVQTWTEARNAERGVDAATIAAFQFGNMPAHMRGTADAVLFIRALHNLARFSDQPYLQQALKNAWDILKPGGVVGVVQHRAPESASADFANGQRGYLKQSFVMQQMLAAGFEFIASSELNANPADQPSETDTVWRLLPSLRVPKDGSVTREQMRAIGESDRMTLKFRKPL